MGEAWCQLLFFITIWLFPGSVYCSLSFFGWLLCFWLIVDIQIFFWMAYFFTCPSDVYFYYPIKLGGSQRVLSQAKEGYICIELKWLVQTIHSIIHTKNKRSNCLKNMFSLFRCKTIEHCPSRQCCRHHASTNSHVFAASRLTSASFKRKSY